MVQEGSPRMHAEGFLIYLQTLIGEYTKGSEAVVDPCCMYGSRLSSPANVWIDGLVGVQGEYK